MSAIPTTSLKSAGGNIIVSASILNAAVAGSIIQANLQWTSRVTAAVEIIIPTSELWLLTDLYVNNAAGAGTDVAPQVYFGTRTMTVF